MNNLGIIRKIDNLGRIVLPKEIRNILNIKSNDDIEIVTDENTIILRKFDMIKSKKSKLIHLCENFNITKNFKIRIIVSNKYIDTNEDISNELLNKLNERKLMYINNNDYKNTIMYPIIKNGVLLSTLILYSNIDENNTLDICKIIANIIINILEDLM